MLFNLDFANDTISSCFFFFFLITYLYFLIPAIIAQIFNLFSELLIPIGIPTKGAKAEIEIHPVIVEAIRKCINVFNICSVQRVMQTFLCFLLINSFYFISSTK